MTTDKKKVLPIPAPPKIIANNTSIQTVQRELQSVIDLNQKINMVQTKKSAQLLRIQDQIMIQQRILNDIQRSVRTPKTGQPSRDALLAQEKLRIIHEESLQNKKTLEDQSQPKKRP